MAKSNKTLIIVMILLFIVGLTFGIVLYKMNKKLEKKKEKYQDGDIQDYVYSYPNGLCKDCEVYGKCMKGCYGLTTNCDSMCFAECNK